MPPARLACHKACLLYWGGSPGQHCPLLYNPVLRAPSWASIQRKMPLINACHKRTRCRRTAEIFRHAQVLFEYELHSSSSHLVRKKCLVLIVNRLQISPESALTFMCEHYEGSGMRGAPTNK